MNFRVNNEKEEIETIPIEKEFAITGQKEFSLWIVVNDDQQPIELRGKLVENEKEHSYTFVPVKSQKSKRKSERDHEFEISLEYQPIAQSKFNLDRLKDAVVNID